MSCLLNFLNKMIVCIRINSRILTKKWTKLRGSYCEGHGLHWLFAIRDFFEKHLSSILFLDSILDWAKLLELDTKSSKVILNATPPKEKKKGNNYKIGPTTMLK